MSVPVQPPRPSAGGERLDPLARLQRQLLRDRLQLNSEEVNRLLTRLRREAARLAGRSEDEVELGLEFAGRELDFVLTFAASPFGERQ